MIGLILLSSAASKFSISHTPSVLSFFRLPYCMKLCIPLVSGMNNQDLIEMSISRYFGKI